MATLSKAERRSSPSLLGVYISKEQLSIKKDTLHLDGLESAVVAAWAVAVMENVLYNPPDAH